MSRKTSVLVAAMKTADKPAAEAPEAAPEPQPEAAASNSLKQAKAAYVAPSRAGKTAKTHFLPRPYWDTLEEVSFRTRDENGKRVPQERLIAEALNLLFLKYNYPQVREE